MRKSEILSLFAYNSWANNKIFVAVSRLNPEQFSAPNPCTGYGSIRGILVHILTAEVVWRTRLQKTNSQESNLDPDHFECLEYLIDRWGEEEAKLQEFLRELPEELNNESILYTNKRGDVLEQYYWSIFLHIINHGTHHRSEVASILAGYGVSPGDMEFIHFLRTTPANKETS